MVRRLLPVLAVGAVALTAHAAWNRRVLRRPTPVDADITESIAVHIPARNEADALGDALASVQQQRGVPQTTIHVLDDGSSDGTAEIAERAAADDPRVRVTRAPDEAPPPGWLGKNFACARLAESTPDASVLVFMDADVVLQPDALNALVHHLRSESADLVAPYPRQDAVTWLERLVQPLLAWSWMTTVPLGVAHHRQWASMSVANGQLLVFDARAYRQSGGHAAVRGDVIEDVALMRVARRAGHRALTVDGSHIASCRMYGCATDLIDGYTKSAWAAFSGITGSIAVNGLLLGIYVVPVIGAVFGRGSTRTWGLAGYVAGVGGRVVVAQGTGERTFPDALAHPASILAFTAINGVSWWRHLRGTTQWKGRRLAE